jgi:molecular chaperone DnaK
VAYSLGIDLGTTFTAAALCRDGRTEIVALGNHAATIPSMVFLREDDNVLIGDAAERRGLLEPSRLAREFKRRLGDSTPILLDRTPFSAERLMAVMLRQIVADVTQRQGEPPSTLAVSHPANWGNFKIDLLRQAVDLAGLPVATYVTEPVAAAVQYASTERVDIGDVIAVYDLGGGTFDAAVLRKTASGFDTLGRPQGIERLGGIDFDEAVFAHVRRVVGEVIAGLDNGDPTARSALARLRQECVTAKETLSSDSDATVPVLLPNVQTQVRITRTEFEDMIRATLRETVESARRAIESAGLTPNDVKAVLLAGGSSRIPLVADMVRSGLGRPVVTDAHPKHAVALGAARIAAGATTGPMLPPSLTRATTPSPPPPPPSSGPGPTPSQVLQPVGAESAATVPVPTVGTNAKSPNGKSANVTPTNGDSTRRTPWGLIAGGVALVAAVVVGALVFTGQGNNDESASPTDTSSETTSDNSPDTTPDTDTGSTDPDDPTTEPTSTPSTAVPSTPEEIEAMIRDIWPDDVEDYAITVARTASNLNPGEQDPTCCYGLFQILFDPSSPLLSNRDVTTSEQLLDPVLNTTIALDLYNEFNGFGPWQSHFESCSTTSGRCVGIFDVLWTVDGVFEVNYFTFGFEPIADGVASNLHVHFFFSSIPPDQVGAPAAGPWFVWDLAAAGGEFFFNGFTLDNLDSYGYQSGDDICITVATHDHALAESDVFYCFAETPTPSAG